MTQGKFDLKASLQRVAQGGIPLRAMERLAEEAGPNRKLFTSDLSVSEFLLAREIQCDPISQVMGSSVVHVGEIDDYKGSTGEIKTISDAHRMARRNAISRIFQEAQLVGADAVIGVHLRDRMITMGKRGKGGDDGGEILELTIVGTAVRAPWIDHPPNSPIVTDLSGQELWALRKDGYEPCGFVFEFCRYHVFHATNNQPQTSMELTGASDAVNQARSIAAQKLIEQATAYQAELVVGSDIEINVREVPCGFSSCELDDVDVDVSWFGTAIRRMKNAESRVHDVPPFLLSMIPVGARHDALIEAEDDADDIEVAAEEAEEAALEADEAKDEPGGE